jgi:catechol 2,3-dioxygenase-like lactoylglutathione lyase family enzyme
MAADSSPCSKSLHHVAYATRDPEATWAFYSGKLGLPLVHTENHLQGEGWFRHFFFDMGNGDYLAFFCVENVGERDDYRTDISSGAGLPVWVNHIAFKLDTRDELEAMKARLKERGVEHLHEIDHGWCHSIYTVDPNGIMVEFCVTTDARAFAQTEQEALRLLRLPPEQFDEESRKEQGVATRA